MALITLTEEQVEILHYRVEQKHLQINKTPLVRNTLESSYTELSETIKSITKVTLKESWLRDFLGYPPTEVCVKKRSDKSIDALCYFVYGNKISNKHFFASDGEKIEKLAGSYSVYWTGNVKNHLHATYTKKLFLELNEYESLLIDGKDIYRGMPIQRIGHKAYVDFRGEKIEERVFFLFHVGDAEKERLNYISGLFAAGDHSNINPTAGPIMLVSDLVPEENLNHSLLKKYFSSFDGNNLIKSWTISQVLEEIQTINLAKTNSKNWNPIDVFLGKKFFVYHWKRNVSQKKYTDCIERSTLEISETSPLATLKSDEGNIFTGTLEFVNPQHIALSISTDDSNTRILFMILKIRTDRVPEIAIGVYNFIADEGFSTAGIALFELFNNTNNELFTAKSFSTDEPNPEIHESIRLFLNKRDNNYVKTPANAVLDYSGLEKFHLEQKKKVIMPDRRSENKGIFIATPMSGDEEIFNRIKDIVNELIPTLSKTYNCKVYYAGAEYNPQIGFMHAYLAVEQDFQELNKSDKFIFIHPKKMQTSTLIELGWALAQNKQILIFYKSKEDLPFLIRELNHVANVRYYKFNDFKQLKNLIFTMKEKLFKA